MTIQSRRSRRGAIIPLMAIIFPVLLILAGLAINIAYLELSQTELQATSDAAVRAAGRTYAMTGDETQALQAANLVGQENSVGNKVIRYESGDLQFGQSLRGPGK